jgi:hypothetical protein
VFFASLTEGGDGLKDIHRCETFPTRRLATGSYVLKRLGVEERHAVHTNWIAERLSPMGIEREDAEMKYIRSECLGIKILIFQG